MGLFFNQIKGDKKLKKYLHSIGAEDVDVIDDDYLNKNLYNKNYVIELSLGLNRLSLEIE